MLYYSVCRYIRIWPCCENAWEVWMTSIRIYLIIYVRTIVRHRFNLWSIYFGFFCVAHFLSSVFESLRIGRWGSAAAIWGFPMAILMVYYNRYQRNLFTSSIFSFVSTKKLISWRRSLSSVVARCNYIVVWVAVGGRLHYLLGRSAFRRRILEHLVSVKSLQL